MPYRSNRTRLVLINLCLIRHVPIQPALIRTLVIGLVSCNRGLAHSTAAKAHGGWRRTEVKVAKKSRATRPSRSPAEPPPTPGLHLSARLGRGLAARQGGRTVYHPTPPPGPSYPAERPGLLRRLHPLGSLWGRTLLERGGLVKDGGTMSGGKGSRENSRGHLPAA